MDGQSQLENSQSDFLNRMDALHNPDIKNQKKKAPSKMVLGFLVGGSLMIGGVAVLVMTLAPKQTQKPGSSVQSLPTKETEADSEVEARNKYRQTDLLGLAEAVRKYQNEPNMDGQLPGITLEEWRVLIKRYIPAGVRDGADDTPYAVGGVCNFGGDCFDIKKLNWTENQHQIFVVYNAECKGDTRDDVIVSSTRKRRLSMFAVVEGDKFICASN